MLNTLDYILLIFLLLGLILGIKKGLIRFVISFCMILTAFFVSIFFSTFFRNIILAIFDLPDWVAIIFAYILIFVTFSILSAVIYKIIKPKSGILSLFNRILGGILGMAQFALIASLILVFLKIFNAPKQEVRDSSIFYGPIYELVGETAQFVNKIFPNTKSIELKKALEWVNKKK